MTLLNKTKSKMFFVFLLLLYFVYGVSYKFTFSVPTTYICALILLFYCSIDIIRNDLKVNINHVKFPLIFAVLLFFISFLNYLYNSDGTPDLYMIKISFMYIVVLFLIPFVVECIFKGQIEILLYLGYVGVINAIFIILMLFVKPFQSFYLSLIDSATFDLVGGSEAIDSLMSLRLVGITGFSAYTTGFLQNILAISMICYIYLSSKKIHIFYYISLGLIIISAIAVARSAIVGAFIIAIISLFYFSFFRVFKIITIITFLGFLSVWGIINILPQELSSFFIHWVTELFSSGMETGSVKSNVSMFIYSPSDFNILGFSKWYGDYGGYFMSTDIGWYRVLFSIGYLGLFIWMFFLVSLIGFDTLIKKNKTCVLGWCILLYIFIMMFKGAVLFDSYQSVFVVGLIFYIIKRTKVSNYKRC